LNIILFVSVKAIFIRLYKNGLRWILKRKVKKIFNFALDYINNIDC